MNGQILPDYSGGGIVNLMQSIGVACGATPALPVHAQCRALPAAQLAEARSIVLVVIDGLGAELLRSSAAEFPNLARHVVGELSSVFPSTTASAVGAFMSGLAPQQSALTGWRMHLEEIGQTLAILPLAPRCEPPKFPAAELPQRLFDHPSFFSRLSRPSVVFSPRAIAGSPFNAWHTQGAENLAYATPWAMFAGLAERLRAPGPRRYFYAYWGDYDTVAHRSGRSSEAARRILADFDAAFGAFLAAVQGSDAWIVASADHGFIDAPREHLIALDEHPDIVGLLERPLCGERRVAYAYVAEPNRAVFAQLLRERFGHALDLLPSQELVAAGWYGQGEANPRLHARIGDFVLVMKDDWTIVDWLPGEKRFDMIGVHGGLSAAEMRVPLIALRV
ncbi:alkaline phosphatase family protein [Rhodocyclus purpureus]|uniref:alkaline phosphatase family protein n=1 Tax=Rhodocyclus purpureus TaxID=1067 RepID=UPI001911D5D3|nr:alkaline phosphatase family protein [Rhodocyclus purpureus]MBK5913065.1 hypothetical protein [Rhodocyclus purpureus]